VKSLIHHLWDREQPSFTSPYFTEMRIDDFSPDPEIIPPQKIVNTAINSFKFHAYQQQHALALPHPVCHPKPTTQRLLQ